MLSNDELNLALKSLLANGEKLEKLLSPEDRRNILGILKELLAATDTLRDNLNLLIEHQTRLSLRDHRMYLVK